MRHVVEDEAAGASWGDGLFDAELGGDFRKRPFVGTFHAVDGDAWKNRDAAGVDRRVAPPAEQRRERLRAAFFPVELGGEVVHPSFAHPFEGVRIELVQLVQARFDIARAAFRVDSERADTEQDRRFFRFYRAVDIADEGVDIVPAPIGAGKRATVFCVSRVGIGVGEIAVVRRFWVGVKIIVEVDAREVVAAGEVLGDSDDMALDGRGTGVHPQQVAVAFGVFGKAV